MGWVSTSAVSRSRKVNRLANGMLRAGQCEEGPLMVEVQQTATGLEYPEGPVVMLTGLSFVLKSQVVA